MKNIFSTTGLRWLWLAVVVLVADLATKQWVMNNMALGQPNAILPFFNLTYAHNPGAAFSFLADKGGWQRWFFAVIALGISVVLLVLMYRTRADNRLNNVAYALIIGGALGNLYDRLMHGVVIDFLDFHVRGWHYPTFNLADTAICIGAMLIVCEGFLTPSDAKKKVTKE